MRHIFTFIFVMLFGTLFVFGQDVTYDGKLSDMDSQKGIDGVTVRVLDGSSVVSSFTTSSNGKYSVQFPVGKSYTIEYSKNGYVSKIIKVDVTKVNAEDMPPGGRIFPPINLDLFTERPGTDFSFLKTEPVATWFFDRDKMNFNSSQAGKIKKKIDDKLKEAENAGGQSDAEYNALIQEADRLFSNKNYQAAYDKYVDAIKIPGKQAESHPNQRIVEIGDILQKQEEENLSFKHENTEYVSLIEAADNYAQQKNYDKAIEKYEEAIRVKSDERYPKDRIKELKEERDGKANQEQYEALIKRADMFFKQKSIEAARDKYEEALEIFPNEKYPKDQLDKISSQMEKLNAEKEQKQKYNAAIEAGDKFFDEEDFENAITKYAEAIAIESAAMYPVERKKMAEERWEEQKAEKEKQENFDRLVAEGNQKMQTEDYEEALSSYNEALGLIPDEEVKTKRDNAQELLDKQNEVREREEKIEAFMQSASEKVSNEYFAEAIEDYEAVLKIDKKHQGAIEGKQHAEEQIERLKKEAENQEEFDELVAQGDSKFNEEEYEEAIIKFEQALKLIEDGGVRAKIENANQLIAEKQEQKRLQEEKENQIASLLTDANTKMEDKDYRGAIDDFSSILGVEPLHREAQEGKEQAENLLNEKEKDDNLNNQFDALVAAGDDFANNQHYEDAISKYEDALQLKQDFDVEEKLRNTRQTMEEQSANQEKQERINALLVSADKKMNEEDYQGAITDFSEVLKLESNHPDALSGKNLAEQKMSEKANAEERQAEFDELVAQADELFDTERWEEAKGKYIAAKGIFENDTHVNDRIDEIRSKTDALADAKRIADEIKTLLAQAEDLKTKNEWKEVVYKYEEALSLDASRQDVSDLLEEARESKEMWEAQQSKEEQFAQLKDSGNMYFAQQEWNKAKEAYESALEIQDDAEISANLETITKEIEKAEEEEAIEQAYREKMEEGEAFAAGDNFESAITSFEAALEIRQNDATATARIQDMRQAITNLSQQEETNEQYNAFLTQGKEALKEEDFASAIKFFDDALEVKPLDKTAEDLKAQAKEAINALKEEERRYNEALTDAENTYTEAKQQENDIDKLESAKEKYQIVQNMRPEASQPQLKIVEINELIRSKKEQQEVEELEKIENDYQNLLDLAKVHATNEQYQMAIDRLKEALELKPDEKEPKDRMAQYQALLDKINEAKNREVQYNSLINEADQAFGSENFDRSIEKYKEALQLKNDESYPTRQIELAQKEKKRIAEANAIREYQAIVDRADTYFTTEDYENALLKYNEAKAINKSDSHVNSRIEITKERLEKLATERAAKEALDARIQEIAKKADNLFDSEKYREAKVEYDKIVELDNDNIYAIDRSKLSKVKAEELEILEKEKAYQEILEKGDNYFLDEDYPNAIAQYKKARALKSREPYPQQKLDEIAAIQNAGTKLNVTIENLGERVNISLLEGAALLLDGEKQREQLKRERVNQQLHRNEDKHTDLSLSDFEQRFEYENEITSLHDRREAMAREEDGMHHEMIANIEGLVEDGEKQRQMIDNFEYGDVYRANQTVDYLNEGMEELRRAKVDEHDGAVLSLTKIKEEREDLNLVESINHHDRATTNSEELVKNDIINEAKEAANSEKKKDLEIKMDDLEAGREKRTFIEGNSIYEQVLQLQDDAILAEIKVAASKENKLATQNLINDDIYLLDRDLERKGVQELLQVHEGQQQVEGQLEAVTQQYVDLKEHKDDERQRTVEQLKQLDKEMEGQLALSQENNYRVAHQNVDEVEHVTKSVEAQAEKQRKDLSIVDDKIKDQIEIQERATNLRNEAKKEAVLGTERHVNRIENNVASVKTENDEKIKNNYEDVKGLEASIVSYDQNRETILKDKSIDLQEVLVEMEKSKRTFSPAIANSIADEYPEGVSQEMFVRKDAEGIPYQIVTRRFVVENGRGDIYIRMQSRNGITYSKNGSPVTEEGWIVGTENARMAKHY